MNAEAFLPKTPSWRLREVENDGTCEKLVCGGIEVVVRVKNEIHGEARVNSRSLMQANRHGTIAKENTQMVVIGYSKNIEHKKNNTRDSNVVPHRSTSLARQCLTSLSRREAVLSLWYGRSCTEGCSV